MIQEEVTTKVGGAIQGLDQVKKKYQEIEAATKNATKAAKDHQKEIEKTAASRGKAVGKIGAGAGNGTLGKIGEASSMGVGLGSLAIGAAILGQAFKTLDMVVGEMTERVRGNIQAQRGMQDAVQGAKDKRSADALSQVDAEENVLRRIAFRGGDKPASYAIGMGKNGVERQDALEAVAELENLAPRIRNEVMRAAVRAARTGETTAAEAVRSVRGSQVMQSLAVNGRGDDLTARMIAKSQSPNDIGVAAFRLRKFEEDGSKVVEQLDEKRANQNKAKEANVDFGLAVEESMKRLAAAIDPVGKAVLDFNNAIQREIEMQDKLISQMSTLERAWDSVTGNKEQLRKTRLQLQAGAASEVNTMTGSTP